MDIFTILLGVVVITASAFMVAAPLVRNSDASSKYQDLEIDREKSLDKRKADIFAILNEIEFDFKTKKLSEQDYRLLKNKYQQEAMAILKEEEEMTGGKLSSKEKKNLEQQVEQEIAQELERLLANKK